MRGGEELLGEVLGVGTVTNLTYLYARGHSGSKQARGRIFVSPVNHRGKVDCMCE